MDSAHTDPELSQWLRWASERGNTPMFVRTVAEAGLIACMPDYVTLRPVLVELKRRYPEGFLRNGFSLRRQSELPAHLATVNARHRTVTSRR